MLLTAGPHPISPLVLYTRIYDKDGKERYFEWLDTETRQGLECIFVNPFRKRKWFELHNTKGEIMQRRHWNKIGFPYDIFIMDVKNPSEDKIRELEQKALYGHS